MGSKVYTSTEITDLRQAAEGEIVTGVGSQLALPGGVALGEGATLSITGAPISAEKTFEQLTSAMDSTLGRVLGLTSQLATGIFEQGVQPKAVTGLVETQQAGILTSDSKAVLVGLGIVIVFFLMGARK